MFSGNVGTSDSKRNLQIKQDTPFKIYEDSANDESDHAYKVEDFGDEVAGMGQMQKGSGSMLDLA
jgi:hypothetical protein